MTRKSTHEQQPNDTQSFEALALRTDKKYDPGLVQFRRAMARAEHILRNDTDGAEAEGVIEELNARWPFHGQEVILSGKVYLRDDDVELHIDKFVPESWGMKRLDRWGTYFEVEDAHLVSMGVVEAAGSAEDIADSTVSYVYGFEAEDDEPSFIVRPNDIYSAEYPYPTYEACEAHLRHEYPELLSEINRRTRPSTYDFNRLNDSLKLLAEKYPDICTDASLGTWVSTYVTRRVNFDRDSSYGFVVKGEMTVPDENGDAEVYDIKEPFGFDARITAVAFARSRENGGDDDVRGAVNYLLILPSGIGDSGEYSAAQAILPVESVQSIEPRRPVHSIVEQLRNALLEKVRPEIAKTGLLQIGDVLANVVDESDSEYDEDRDESLTKEQRWLALEQHFATVIQKLSELRAVSFRSEDAAKEAAEALVGQMNGLLRESDELYTTAFSFSGPGVGVPAVTINQQAEDSGQQLIFGVEKTQLSPSRAQDVRGTFYQLHATAEEAEDDKYLPLIYLTFGYKQDAPQIPMLAIDSTPLVVAEIKQAGTARMDGTSTIEIIGLERIRRTNRALNELASLDGARLEKKVLGRLGRAINRELADTTIPLEDLNILKSVGNILNSTSYPNEVLNVLKGLVADGRYLVLTGKVSDAHGNLGEISRLHVVCIDVVASAPNLSGNVPALVVRQNDGSSPFAEPKDQPPLMYVPLNGITSFNY